jgi:hypothetical protein
MRGGMNNYDQKKKDFVLDNIDFSVSDIGLLASQLHCRGSARSSKR